MVFKIKAFKSWLYREISSSMGWHSDFWIFPKQQDMMQITYTVQEKKTGNVITLLITT